MKLAVCVVNWFGAEDTGRCLSSLAKYCKDAEVYLLENGSGQGDLMMERADSRTRVMLSDENLGFAAGCNLLMKEALSNGADVILLMNNDAEATEGFADDPMRLLSGEGVGFVESLILTADGLKVDTAGHRHLSSGDVIPEGRGLPACAVSANSEILSGCAASLFLKSEMLRDIGLFEDDFFLGYEDVDLTYRASMMGWRGVMCASSVVKHRLNASIEKVRDVAYYTRSQRNALLSYLYNTPAAVVAANLPWVLLKYAAVTLSALLFGRPWVVGVYWRALFEVMRQGRGVARVRRERLKKRKLGSLDLWLRQKNPVPSYLKLFGGVLRLVNPPPPSGR